METKQYIRPTPRITRFRLKQSVYALQDPSVPGLYIRLGGSPPRLVPLPLASYAPATDAGIDWLAERASQLAGTSAIYDMVRVDA